MYSNENIAGNELGAAPDSEKAGESGLGGSDFSGTQEVMIKAVTKDVVDRNPGASQPQLIEWSLMEILGAAAALLKNRTGKGN